MGPEEDDGPSVWDQESGPGEEEDENPDENEEGGMKWRNRATNPPSTV